MIARTREDLLGSTPRAPIPWTDAEPVRLARDLAEVSAFAPGLAYQPPRASSGREHSQGGWVGELPLWPFARSTPPDLQNLLNGQGLRVAIAYPSAYPMVPPVIYPVDPEPTFEEQTQTEWHVAPGGSLCLLQSDGAWQPDASLTELLAKACGWHVEYALMKAGVIERMSTNGIVSDPGFDDLVGLAVARARHNHESSGESSADEP